MGSFVHARYVHWRFSHTLMTLESIDMCGAQIGPASNWIECSVNRIG